MQTISELEQAIENAKAEAQIFIGKCLGKIEYLKEANEEKQKPTDKSETGLDSKSEGNNKK